MTTTETNFFESLLKVVGDYATTVFSPGYQANLQYEAAITQNKDLQAFDAKIPSVANVPGDVLNLGEAGLDLAEEDVKILARRIIKVIKEMWNLIPRKYQTIIKFVVFIFIVVGVMAIPFMIIVLNSIVIFFRKHPEILLL